MGQVFTTTTGVQTLTADAAQLQTVVVTSAAAATRLKIYGNGVQAAEIAVVAGATQEVHFGNGSNQFNGLRLAAPVTIDLSGSGASATLLW